MGDIPYLHPQFAQIMRQPVEQDTALMSAIRNGDRGAIASLAQAGDSDLSAANDHGETALYLALRTGQFEVVEALLGHGAADAEAIIADPPVEIPPQLAFLLQDGPLTDADILQLLAHAPLVRGLKFENLSCLRRRLGEYIDRLYPRTRRLTSLAPDREAAADAALSAMRNSGIAPLGNLLSATEVAEIRESLSTRPCYFGHVVEVTDRTPHTVAEAMQNGPYGCYDSATALTLPYLWNVANSPMMLKIVSEYLGCMPTIYGSNVLWSFPHDQDDLMCDSQSIHRDYDYYSFVSLFIYLTDVDSGNGPHRYYAGTHNIDRIRELLERRFSPGMSSLIGKDLFRSILDCYGRNGMIEDLFADQICDVLGSAGTAFLADTHGFHRATRPLARPRLMAWFRYGAIPVGREQFPTAVKPSHPNYDPYVNRVLFSVLDAQPRETAG